MHQRVVLLLTCLAAAHASAAPNDQPTAPAPAPNPAPAPDPAPAPAPTPAPTSHPAPPPIAVEPPALPEKPKLEATAPTKPAVTVFGRVQLLSQIDPQNNGDVPDTSVLPGGMLKKDWNASVQVNGALGGRFVYPKPIGGFTASGQVVTVVFVRRIFTVPIMGFTLDNPEAGVKIGIGKFVQPTVSPLSPGAFQFSATWGNLLHETTGAYVAKTVDHFLFQLGVGRPDSDLFLAPITPTANALPSTPFVEWRAAYIDRRFMGEMPATVFASARPAPLMVGLSGAVGRQRVGINEKTFVQMTNPGAVDPLVEDETSWLVSAELVLPFHKFLFAGEWYIGRDTNPYVGAVRQLPHVDPMTGHHTALDSRGGWLQLSYSLPMHCTALMLVGLEHVTGGLDVGVPVDNPLKISENRLIAMSVAKNFDIGMHAGVQVQHQTTHYVGLMPGDMFSVLLESSIDF